MYWFVGYAFGYNSAWLWSAMAGGNEDMYGWGESVAVGSARREICEGAVV
jgi:hypothetical protein